LPTLGCSKLPELPARRNIGKSNPSEVETSSHIASRKVSTPEVTLPQLTPPEALPQLTPPEAPSFAARHRQTLRDRLDYDSAAEKIQKSWSSMEAQPAGKRLVSSRARQLHMERACWKEREALRKQTGSPCLPWEAKEVAEDILAARRSVRISSALLEDLQTAALKNKADPKRWKLVKSHGRNLMALGAVTSILEDSHSAEVQWMELMESIQDPL